jgi:hypothetical protein
VIGVRRRVEGRQLVAERISVADASGDQVGDIVALERYGNPGNGPVTEIHDENVSASL